MQYQERKRAEFEFHRRKHLLKFPAEVRIKEKMKEEGEGIFDIQLRKLLKSPRVEGGPVVEIKEKKLPKSKPKTVKK